MKGKVLVYGLDPRFSVFIVCNVFSIYAHFYLVIRKQSIGIYICMIESRFDSATPPSLGGVGWDTCLCRASRWTGMECPEEGG